MLHPHRARHLPALVAILLLPALPAMAATPLACGSYQAADRDARFVIESPTQAVQLQDGQAPTRYLIRQQGQTLHAADLSAGFGADYTLSADGKRIGGLSGDYVLHETTRCKTALAPPANSCRADIDTCMDAAYNTAPAQLRQWCQEDLPFACERLLSSYGEQARASQASNLPKPDLTEPAACKEDTPAFDEDACRAAAREVLGQALAQAMAGVFTDGTQPALPATQLDEVLQLCRQHPDAGFCNKVADAHLDAGQYLGARAALQLACTAGNEERTCQRAQTLHGLGTADLVAVAATALPCGDYSADSGLIDALSFGDQGLVSMLGNGVLRARLQDGAVHIRHDKGGDFVLQPLADGRLLGVDTWSRYALYQRNGGATHCDAPVQYVETPLPQDCPLGSDPQACCAAGKLQGCNTLGHHKALAGDWDGAAPYYLNLCRAGVRASCENLRTVYENTGDEDIPGKLLALCKQDGKGTHVACDLHETTDWAMLGLDAQLMQMQAVEPVEADATPTDAGNRKSPRK